MSTENQNEKQGQPPPPATPHQGGTPQNAHNSNNEPPKVGSASGTVTADTSTITPNAEKEKK